MSMVTPAIWTFRLAIVVALAAPVRAQCNPSQAVVAIASILSTLAVVTIVLIGVYLFMRRRRQAAHKLPPGWEKKKNRRDGHHNRGYRQDEDNVTFKEGVTPSKRPGHANSKEQVLPRKHKDEEIWPSLQRSGQPGRWYRESSNLSLDGALNFTETEIISVTLESQDIIGLGFNISGSYGDGIHISEVHNRGPAKQSGVIKTGDRILSVKVSYQNIVYEDALTILSYASPYSVTIDLQKGTHDNLKDFVDETRNGQQKRRIKHPLYHSRSLDTFKSVTHSQTSGHRKRAISDLKMGSVKHFFNWHGNNSKKRQVATYKDETTFSMPPPLNKNTLIEGNHSTCQGEVNVDVTGKTIDKTNTKNNTYQVKQPGQLKVPSRETVAEIMSTFDMNSDEDICQKPPPDKPERRNRRQSDIQDSSTNLISGNDQLTPATTGFVYSISSVTDDEVDVDEALTGYEVSTSGSSDDEYDEQGEEASRNSRTSIGTSRLDKGSVAYILHKIAQSPKSDPSETTFNVTNRSETSFVHSDLPFISNKNSRTVGELKNYPVLDEENVNRITAGNSLAPSTYGWEDVHTGEHKEYSADFAAHTAPPTSQLTYTAPLTSQLTHKSNWEDLFSATSIHTLSEREPIVISEEQPLHVFNFSSEFQNTFVTDNPLCEKINDPKHLALIEPMESKPTNKCPVGSNTDDSDLSMTFVNGQTITHSNDTYPRDTNDGSETNDSLEWSGTRLVRSESLSNIFLSDS